MQMSWLERLESQTLAAWGSLEGKGEELWRGWSTEMVVGRGEGLRRWEVESATLGDGILRLRCHRGARWASGEPIGASGDRG